MKTIIRTTLLLFFVSFMAACSSSDHVADRGIIQKRKYRKGYHLDVAKHFKRDTKRYAAQSIEDTDEKGKRNQEPETTLGLKKVEATAAKEQEEKGGSRAEKWEGQSKSNKAQRIRKNEARAVKWAQRTQRTKEIRQQVVSTAVQKVGESKLVPKAMRAAPGGNSEAIEIVTLLMGILTWLFVIGGTIAAFLGIPYIALFAIPCALVGFFLGRDLKDDSSIAMIGYALCLVYLIVAAILLGVSILLLLFFLVLFLLILGSL